MDTKLELTKKQLETILKLINDANFNSQETHSPEKEAARSNAKSMLKLEQTKKRSYSAVNLKNATSTDELINESFRKSISNLIDSSKRIEKFPEIKASNAQQPQVKLKRNKSLIELRKEKWDRERDELKQSDFWYEKFDSLKKPSIDRSRSQPDISPNYNAPFNRFVSVSRLYSPVSHFDDESIVLSNLQSPTPSHLNRSGDLSADETMVNELINQPRRSFHRYAHQFNNINLLDKRRKQQEYQAQLDAQLNYKREHDLKLKERQKIDDRRLEEKLVHEQAELRKEFEFDHHKGELVRIDVSQIMKGRKVNERSTNGLEKLEKKGKELIKVFKEASTQTEDKETTSVAQARDVAIVTRTNDMIRPQSPILQPVRSNRSALLRTISRSSSKPKWTKQSKDEDNRTSILPRLTQKGNQLHTRKKWNS